LIAHTLTHRFIDVPYLLTLFESRQIGHLDDLVEALWSFSDEE
jgi:hypothetical protein